MTRPYYCTDCGQRFFNLGWHAESCGSWNFARVLDDEHPPRLIEIDGRAMNLLPGDKLADGKLTVSDR